MKQEKSMMICVNWQTKERRLLPESEALDLDQRLWSKKVWHCTAGRSKPAPKRFPEAVMKPDWNELVPVGFMCPVRKCYSLYPMIYQTD